MKELTNAYLDSHVFTAGVISQFKTEFITHNDEPALCINHPSKDSFACWLCNGGIKINVLDISSIFIHEAYISLRRKTQSNDYDCGKHDITLYKSSNNICKFSCRDSAIIIDIHKPGQQSEKI